MMIDLLIQAWTTPFHNMTMFLLFTAVISAIVVPILQGVVIYLLFHACHATYQYSRRAYRNHFPIHPTSLDLTRLTWLFEQRASELSTDEYEMLDHLRRLVFYRRWSWLQYRSFTRIFKRHQDAHIRCHV